MPVIVHNNVVSGPEERSIPAHLSYGQFLFDQLKNGGDNVALVSAETGESVTYRYILQKSVNLAVSLQKLGLKKGDLVGLSSENRFEFVVAALAVVYCGGVLSTLNITYTPGEISHLLKITKPKFIFISPITSQNIYDCCHELSSPCKLIMFGEFAVVPECIMYDNLIEHHVNVDDFTVTDVSGTDDTVAVMCSSGTTGLPKGVELTHVNFLTLSAHMKYYFGYIRSQKNNGSITGLSLIPWFHAYGFITTFAVMAMNIKIVFLIRFDEEQYLETIQNYKINMTTIVPPLAVFLAKHPLVPKYDLSSLVEVWCGAAPLSKDIQKAVSERTGINFIKQGYGLTEVTMACLVDLTSGKKVGSCGTPAPGMRVKVVNFENGQKLGPGQEGELWIKSPLRMKGYMGDRAASDELFDNEGYVRTGDIGYYDNEGYFYIVDRLKELIKYKGFQVAPAELEALLLQHSGVADVGVVGLPDEAAGELPLAFVVAQPNSDVTEEELVEFVASRMDLSSQNEKIVQWLADSETESIPGNQPQSSDSEDGDHLETEIHSKTDGSDEDAADSSDDEFFVPRRSHSRRLVIDSDDDTSLTSGMDQMDPEHEEPPQQQSIIQPRQNILFGKNQYKWSTKSRDPRTRTAARNVLHIVPGPVGIAKELSEPKDLFHLFVEEEMINVIVQYTNVEIDLKNYKYKTAKYTTSQTSANEIKALLGLLIQSAGLKSNHLPTRTLFDTMRSAKTYKACMSAERFDFLLRCMRFDDRNTRQERRVSDRLAPIRIFWEKFIANCRKWYRPGSYITVDEQLVGFRGRCPFRMYIPNKPNKYGLKLVMMADSSTKYMCNAMPYMGKNTNTGNEPLANYFVKELSKPYHGSNRNVTMDNWFTSVPLATELLKPPYKLTVVGTLRSNKREIPKEMSNSRNRRVGTSMFGFDKEMTLVSYKPKSNKVVYLLSTIHDQPAINIDSNKPEIIEFYNSTKGAVDTVDQMCSIMSTSRKTNRWPLCLFYDILNLSIVNAYVIHVSNAIRNGKKPLKRRPFALEMADALMKPWLQERYQTATLQRNLKQIIAEILKIDDPQEGSSQDVPRTRKTCSYCPAKKRRMTTNFCKGCKKAICREHIVSMCNHCSV